MNGVTSSVCVFSVCVCYLQVKRLLVRDSGGKPLQAHQRLLAGSSAGVMAQITIYPMEVQWDWSMFAVSGISLKECKAVCVGVYVK